MFVIHKLTFAYRPLEDRICIIAAAATDETLCLWLTRRLAFKLIPHLPSPTMPRDGAHAARQNSDATEQASDAASGNSSAVECEVGKDEFLIVSIDLKHREEQWILIFKDARDHDRAAVSLDLNEGHQIVDALNDCFQAAGWAADDLGKAAVDLHPLSLGEVTVH